MYARPRCPECGAQVVPGRSTVTCGYCAAVLVAADTGSPEAAGPEVRSRSGDRETRLTFENHCPEDVLVYWVDYEGVERHYFTLRPGESREQPTYASHPWRARARSSGRVRAEVVAAAEATRVRIE